LVKLSSANYTVLNYLEEVGNSSILPSADATPSEDPKYLDCDLLSIDD